ncbi:GDPP1 phosphorylase, partial [Piaya cayana]|nr:GDPP1 phosphorylase [Piaya cayana]
MAEAACEDADEPGPEDFVYGEEDFVLQDAGWEGDPAGRLSRFDRALLSGWSDRASRGLFRYRLGALPTRALPGAAGLVAQLNARRGSDRRPPQPVLGLRQPFDPAAFHFGRLRRGEQLLRLRRAGSAADPLLVAINASPLSAGHVLLLPEPARPRPQALSEPALRAALEVQLLSAHPGFRVGFNGLGGFASVNHLHLHGLYLPHPLPVESAPARPLQPRGPGLLLRDPAPAFVFFAAGPAELDVVARDVCRAAEHVVEAGLAYNVLATRGEPLEGAAGGRGLRVLLWARRPSFGTKAGDGFNVALCELGGFLPITSETLYNSITEDEALRTIRQHLLPEDELLSLGEDLARLLAE